MGTSTDGANDRPNSQQCSVCLNWHRRTLNMCPTCHPITRDAQVAPEMMSEAENRSGRADRERTVSNGKPYQITYATTPRTEEWVEQYGQYSPDVDRFGELLHFTRQLERELNEALRETARVERLYEKMTAEKDGTW